MADQTPPEDSASPDKADAAGKLTEDLRALIRQEIVAIGKPAEPPAKVTPSQVFWAGLVILDGILLASLVPEEWLKDERVKLLMDKFVPWMCASLALAVYAAFQAQTKIILSRRWFRIALPAATFVLSLLAFPVLPFRPALQPADSLLKIDDGEPQKLLSGRWLRIQPYRFEVSVADTSGTFKNRVFRLGAAETIESVFSTPSWPIRRQVKFNCLGSQFVLTLQRQTPFDAQYHKDELDELLGLKSNEWEMKLSGDKLVLTNRQPQAGYCEFGPYLPLGNYSAFAVNQTRQKPAVKLLRVDMDGPTEVINVFEGQ
jgi:hypothetical protein